MVIGPGNYEVAYSDVAGGAKKVTLYLAEEHIDILQSSGFRVISGWEKRMGKTLTKVITLGGGQGATLELVA